MAEPTLLILAAGAASRFGRLKQLEPVGPRGQAVLDYTLLDAWRAGFKRFAVVIRPSMRAAFEAHLSRTQDRWEGASDLDPRMIALVDQAGDPEHGPWGTGHAVLSAQDKVDGPFAVANADDFYGRSSLERLAAHLRGERGRDAWALVSYSMGRTLSPHGGVSRGICVGNPDGSLASVREAVQVRREEDGVIRDGQGLEIPDDTPASMNLWGFDERVFALLEESAAPEPDSGEFRLPDAVGQWIAQGRGRVRLLQTQDRWFGLTYPEDLPGVQEAIAALHAGGSTPGLSGS
jgi:dTDP-glucose pyrophosphorylase